MNEAEPVRLRLDPESPRELCLALRDSPHEMPSDAALGELRLALTARVGEPKRLNTEPTLARALGASGGPSPEQLRALRARLPAAPKVVPRKVRTLKPKRRAAVVLAWLLPAAAAAMSGAYYATHQDVEPAPSASVVPAPKVAPPPSPAAPTTLPSTEEPSAPSASASPPKRAPSPTPVHSDPEAELRLIREAQAALGSNPARALSLAAEHARDFPRGVLSQEREVVSIDALNRLGRTTEARARAERFRKSNPGSAYLPRIERLVGAAPASVDSAKPASSGYR